MSTINYTYNVIVDRFRQFAAGHFQLRRFTHGEISQADLEKEAEWPWMHVKPRAINYSPGTRAFSFEIFISDLPRDKEDKTGYQAESITDCSLIFQDLINEIHLGHMFGDDVVLTRPVNSEPFVEQYTHTLTGVTGTIELSLDYDWSACSIPASWNYNTPTNSPNDGFGALQFIDSLDQNGVFVSLLNDEEAPGNSYYYGTDGSGVKGWYAIVDNIGLTCETLPDCAVIIGIVDDIIALQTDVALKANTADLGATAFSNDYGDLDNLPTIPAAQVNADWNAVSGVAQILNKPTLTNGTVTSVGLTAGTGISVSGGPITSSGSITVTNSAPDQVVALTAGTGIGVTGTYPNFTVTNSAPSSGGTVTAVTATAPMSSTGGAAPNLSMSSANGTTNGYLLSSDWLIFNGKFNTPAGTTLQYVRGDGSLATFPTIPTSLPPSGAAGGDLSGTYPNPNVSRIHGIDMQNGTPSANDTWVYGGSPAKWQHQHLNASQVDNDSSVTGATVKLALEHLDSTKVPTTRTLTINGTTQDLSANRTFTIASNPGTVTSVAALTLGTSGADLSSTVATGTTTPVITLNVPTASAANRGALSSADWSTFNGKQAALGFTAENTANKQNSLAVDGTGVKFPTVDAVNNLSFIDKGKRMVSFFTDFLTNATLDGGQSFASGGSLGLIVGSQIPNRTNQQGVAFFQTNTVATNYINYCSSSGAAQLWFGGGTWNFETLINISNLSTALERYRISFGFGSVISNSSESDGVFITYDEGGTANGTVASANWQCVTVANSVRTLTTSTTAVTAAAWNKLRIEINAAGTSVTFYVNGTAIATHTTNIPLASNSRYVLMKTGLAKTIGITTRGFYCDYIGYENILTTAR